MDVTRREAIGAVAGTLAVGSVAGVGLSAQAATTPTALSILAMIAYPGMFPLDIVGPDSVFAGMGTHRVVLVGRTTDPLKFGSFSITPQMTFAEAEAAGKIDILFVPGGTMGTLAAMEEPELQGFLRRHAADASHVTSICTGSLILAAAGQLKGIRATSHWVVRDRLKELGAIPVKARVVDEGRIVTGAGVTAGIDMALTLAAKLAGAERAKALQLNIEYDPDPPFPAGTPEGAGPAVVDRLTQSYRPFLTKVDEVVPRVAARLRGG